jgi:ligand-binding SRPBCC domain-containing protein
MASHVIGRFVRTHTLEAPLEKVRAFYQSSDVLARLTPPLVVVDTLRCEPLGPGSIAEFELRLPFAPRATALRWRARHGDFATELDEHGSIAKWRFADVMEHGPLASWHHVHEFSRLDAATTRVCDQVSFQHADGARGWATRAAFNPASLSALFAWRAAATRWHLTR